MSTKYWIKLYHEIIDDPKMGRLTDRLWRRTIELFLMAGDIDKTGKLPAVDDLSWRLRVPIDDLETDLADLASVGILHKSNGSWIVTNFAKRQKPMEKDEYMRRLRNERQRDVFVTDKLPDSDLDVTNPLPEVTQKQKQIKNREEEEEERSTPSPQSFPTSEYEHYQNNGTPAIEQIYSQVTQQVGISSNAVDKVLNDLGIVVDYFKAKGEPVDTAQGQRVFAKWCNTTGKNGRRYSKTNPGWVQWWIDELAPLPVGDYSADLPAYLTEAPA